MAFQVHVDWAWGNHGSPKVGDWCTQDEIAPGIKRMYTSAHDCVVNAIRAARAGRSQEALNWLAATQCHNPPARGEIAAAAGTAVQYAVDTYGPHVP